MGRKALVLMGLFATAPAAAQSRVDRVPETTPTPQLPVNPAPPDELNDAPERKQPQPELVTPEPEPPARLVPGAPDSDSLTGHFLPHLAIGYSVGYGHIDNASATSDLLAPGMNLGFGLGYGISRNLELGLAGSYASVSGGDSCPNCTGRIMELQLYVAYHLVQGTRFDPWVRFGTGMSSLRITDASHETDYAGLTVANIVFGGDWFASKYIGLGPVLSFGLNTYLKTPNARSAALSERLMLGARVTFDLAGR